MSDEEIFAQVVAVRRLAERFQMDFDQMLDDVLRRFPPDLIKRVRAKLYTLPHRPGGNDY